MAECDRLSEAFLEQSPACFWMVDANLVFRRIYGLAPCFLEKTAEEMIGRNVTEVLGGLAQTWSERFARALAGETVYLQERRRTGVWYISVFPVHAEDGSQYVGVMAREITKL